MKLSAGCATNSRFGRLCPDVRRPPGRIVRSLFVLAAVSAVAPLLIACTGVSINPSFPEIAAAQSSPTATLSQATNVANTDISAINFDSLRIIAPGEGSRLISPIHLQAQIPAETAVVRVELYGSDNRLMLRKLLRTADSGQLNLELVFEVPASSERGRLVLSLFILAAVSAVAPLLIACTGVSINTSFPEIAAAQSSPTATLSQATNIADTDISAINFDSLRIIAPGEGSRLISPIHLQAQIPAETDIVRVELYGNDNRLMLRKLLRTADSGQLNLELAFEVPASSERGRLVLSLEDDYGRLQELDSIQVELLTSGESQLVPSNTQERLALNSPQAKTVLQGGQLPVSGLVRAPYGPLNIQLITREGRVLTSDDVFPDSTQGETGTFTTVLAYSLQNLEWVQVRVSLRVGGITWAVKSVEVWLEP